MRDLFSIDVEPEEGPPEFILCDALGDGQMRAYRLRETTFRGKPAVVISWIERDKFGAILRQGVIGGYHADHAAAERAIDIAEAARHA